MKSIKNVGIVGAGTAGLITAIILKKHLKIDIDVIYSKNIPIIGVGEGSTEHFTDFIRMIGVDHKTIISECNATYKTGIMFKNWSQKDYLHNISEDFNFRYSQYNTLYGKQISENSSYLVSNRSINSKIPLHFLEMENTPINQFHFDTFKLNSFLIDFATKMGINFTDDEIIDAELNFDGEIKTIIGKKNKYSYDFYIDSTGFKKILISKLGGKWLSFSKYLRMNSAITFQTGDENNYNLWTLSEAMNYGWRFKIPVWGRHGNGYIYDNQYINIDDAVKEIENKLGKKINIGKTFNFDPGAIDRPWIKNCVAVGLSSSFFEPLEATSIGSSIQQAFLLMNRLPTYNDQTIKFYNKSVNNIIQNILEFVSLHYITEKNDTLFWKDLKSIKLLDSLREKLELWNAGLPIAEDFGNNNYIMFSDKNFISVMHGLNMFDNNIIVKKYNLVPDYIKNLSDQKLKETKNNDFNQINKNNFITHKEYIKIIRKEKGVDF